MAPGTAVAGLAVAERVKAHARTWGAGASGRSSAAVVWVPRCGEACAEVLRREGVWGDLGGPSGAGAGCALGFLPAAAGTVLSLEDTDAYREWVADGDARGLRGVVEAVRALERGAGPRAFVRLTGKGPTATALVEALVRAAEDDEEGLDVAGRRGAVRGWSVVVLDRDLDPVTPMLTQLTYGGLLDDVAGVRGDTLLVADCEDAARDGVFAELQHLGVASAGPRLHRESERFRGSYRRLREEEEECAQVGAFVRELGATLPSLQAHVGLAERLRRVTDSASFRERLALEQAMQRGAGLGADATATLDAVFLGFADGFGRFDVAGGHEEAGAGEAPLRFRTKAALVDALKVACLWSASGGGLPAQTLDAVRRELVAAFGHELAPVLVDLERIGLLRRRPEQTPAAAASSPPPGGAGAGPGAGPGAEPGVGVGAGPRAGAGAGSRGRVQGSLPPGVHFPGCRALFDLFGAPEDPASEAYAGYIPLLARIAEVFLDREALSAEGAERPGADVVARWAAREAAIVRRLHGPMACFARAPGAGGGSGFGGWTRLPEVSGAFAPAARRGESASRMGMERIEAALAGFGQLVPGAAKVAAVGGGAPEPPAREGAPAVLVLVLGGVTLGEVAVLRHIADRKGMKVVIATTAVVTGARLLESLIGHVSDVEDV